jgi:hypothetical protein
METIGSQEEVLKQAFRYISETIFMGCGRWVLL